jgi:hypothetical protein
VIVAARQFGQEGCSRYNQAIDLSQGAAGRCDALADGCPGLFSVGYVMAPDADHNFTEAQMIDELWDVSCYAGV